MAHIADGLPDNHEFLVRSGPIIGFLRITSRQAAIESITDDATVLQGLANHLAAYGAS